MTRRKDPQPETLQPEISQPEPFATEVDPDPVTSPKPASPDPVVEVTATTVAPSRGSGILGPLLGGALAAAGGFALAHFNVLGLASTDATELAALTAQLDQAAKQQAAAEQKQGADIAALADRITALESAPAPVAPDLSRLDSLDQRLSTIESMPSDGTASTAALTAKIAELERSIAAMPIGGSDPALQQKLDDALARLAEAETAATARAGEAEAAAQAAARAQALDALADAVNSGQPYAAELQAADNQTLAETLGPTAETGVPTLAKLQADFPDAARSALRLSRDLSTEDGWSDRLVDFLAAQTGARPLTPLQGDTPDAMLSRAEFALSAGRVAEALAELDPLDPAVKAPLDPWIAQAKAHLAAIAALQTARGE